MLHILRQSDSSVESRIAAQYALMNYVRITAISIEGLPAHAKALRKGRTLPIGSVEFIRAAMHLTGIAEPENISYPKVLQIYLRRAVSQRSAGSVLGHWFIKPVTTKAFTGFVVDTMGNPDHLSCHDRAQYNEFLALPMETMVWLSEPVVWQSEYRYYVINGEVRGEGRYDDGPDDMPAPDMLLVKEMAWALACADGAPAAFSLDVGVLDSGETALIECNDAWALGYYKGSLLHHDYIQMLRTRWDQLLCR